MMRKMSSALFFSLVIVLASLLTFVLPGAPALAAGWGQSAGGGIGGGFKSADETCSSMAVYNNQLYAGTYNAMEGCGVWRLEGAEWVRANEPGFGDREVMDVACMAVFRGNLFAGTGNVSGCEVWVYNGSAWIQVVGPDAGVGLGFGNPNNIRASSMAVFGDYLYVGTQSISGGLEIWRTGNGTAWTRVDAGSLGASNVTAACMKVYDGKLYVGTRNATGCQVWRSGNGTEWSAWYPAAGFGAETITAASLEEFGGLLYLGTENNTSGLQVWRTDGLTYPVWSQVGTSPLVGAGNKAAASLRSYGGKLHAGTSNPTGGQLWSYDGSAWARTDSGIFDQDCRAVSAMGAFGGRLYAGTSGVCEIWSWDGAWRPASPRGFTANDNTHVPCMAPLDGYLYAGTESRLGCEVWRFDGGAWKLMGKGGFGNDDNRAASSMASYGGTLYVGTRNYFDGCEVWRLAGETFERVAAGGFGDAGNSEVLSMTVYGGMLYAGTFNQYSGGEIWRWDGSSWKKANASSLGDADAKSVDSLAVYKGRLYAGVSNGSGCRVWSTAAVGGPPYTDWTQANADGFGSAMNYSVLSMAVYGDSLFVGTGNYPTGGLGSPGGQIWAWDGSSWKQANASGFGDPVYKQVDSMAVYDGRLYASASCAGWITETGGLRIWSTSGAGGLPYGDWTQEGVDGFGTGWNGEAPCLTPYFSSLLAGVNNFMDGCQVWNAGSRWYLAEGATAGGFETWVLVQNPGAAPVHADFTLNTDTGVLEPPDLQGVEIPAGSRASFSLGNWVTTYDVSTKVEAADGLVICERAMYWTPGAAGRVLGHDSVGVTAPAATWYLAEGATAGGFETWVLVQNPGAAPVHADFTLNTDTGVLEPPDLQGVEIPAGSRRTFNLGSWVSTYDVSTKVAASGGKVICERAMYWTPPGGVSRVLGHDSVGVTAPSAVWYLAEGATAGGFETWVLVQNPGAAPVKVDFTLNTDAGEVKPADLQGVEIPAGSRRSFNLGGWVQTYDVSTKVEASEGKVICERAMYWTPGGGSSRVLGHDSVGVTAPSAVWYLAEGATAGGFETWVLVQNPGAAPVRVDFTLNTDAGEVKPPDLQGVEIPAGSRRSFNLGAWMQTYDVSTKVTATGGLVICERAMYWTPGGAGRVLGHDSIGYSP